MGPKKHQSQAERFVKTIKGSTGGGDVGFISFSDVVQYDENRLQSSSSSSSPFAVQTPIYTGSDLDLYVISKKLKKNNSATRLKALYELKPLLQVFSLLHPSISPYSDFPCLFLSHSISCDNKYNK